MSEYEIKDVQECSFCGGTGVDDELWEDDEPEEDCPECDGTGFVSVEDDK